MDNPSSIQQLKLPSTKWLKLILGGIVGVAFVMWLRLFLAPEPEIFNHAATGLEFKYSSELELEAINQSDLEAGIIARLKNQAGRKDLLITVRTESGLSQSASVTRQAPLDVVLDSAERSYPGRFPGYQELSLNRFLVSGRPAAEIRFSYDSPQAEVIEQRFIVIIKDDDLGIYISLQARSDQFASISQQYFQPVVESLKIN